MVRKKVRLGVQKRKKEIFYLVLPFSFSLIYVKMKRLFLLIGVCLILIVLCKAKDTPRVLIFTDINIDSGDPDDRQSLIHLLWYANELEIKGLFRIDGMPEV